VSSRHEAVFEDREGAGLSLTMGCGREEGRVGLGIPEQLHLNDADSANLGLYLQMTVHLLLLRNAINSTKGTVTLHLG
jgi:hypothetical protein